MQYFTSGSRSRAFTLFLLCGAFVALPKASQAQRASTLSSQGLALNRAGEALGNVIQNAKKVNQVLKYGFYEQGCVFGVMLRPGASASETFALTAGKSYIFIGGSDNSGLNVDLNIRDSSGRVLKSDNRNSIKPYFLFKPTRTGRYKMTLRLASSKRGSAFCAATVLQKGGYDVPLDRIQQAVAKAAVASAVVFRGVNGGRFNQDRDTWGIYGAVLKPKQSISSDFKKYSTANRAFIGVGDNRVNDLDLVVLKSQKQAVAADTKNGSVASLAYKTVQGTYSVGLINNSSNGPALVMALLMDLPAGLKLNTSASGTGVQSAPSPGRRSPFVGNWSGDWQDDGNRQEGECEMNIGTGGAITGRIVNSTINATTPIRGAIQPNGVFTFAYSYAGQNYVARGTMRSPRREGDDIGIGGQVTFTTNGQAFGKADFSLYKN